MKKIRPHIEWVAFTTGLVLMAMMDPLSSGSSFCFFEFVGIEFCPGEGLGHSIAWVFRGEFENAVSANLFGIPAVLILSLRILQIWKDLYLNKTTTQKGHTDGRSL
ncbi:MAG: DUF2752 domain-containing protein [Balneola sp.]|tara:strand:- start:197018 stop:197335 length:318 start_codon:yes stop_codon:yes gene_type:complete